MQRTGVGANQQPPRCERQPARRPVDPGRPPHRAVRQRSRLDEAVAAEHNAVGQGDDRAPARGADGPLLGRRPGPLGGVERLAELAQLALQPGPLPGREAALFQFRLQRLDALGGALGLGTRAAVRQPVDGADAVFIQQKTVAR